MAGQEATIERATCKKALELYGVKSLKLKQVGETGWPDRIFFIPGGQPLFIEFKAPGEVASPKQKYIHQLLIKLGYKVEVHDNTERALCSITKALDASRVPEKRR